MSRVIVTRSRALKENKQPDSTADVLMKLLPAETTAAYLTIVGATRDIINPGTVNWVIGAGVVLMILTPVYMWFAGKVRNFLHLAATMVGFGVWAMGIGWPLQQRFRYEAWQIGIVLVLYSVVLVIVAAAVGGKEGTS